MAHTLLEVAKTLAQEAIAIATSFQGRGRRVKDIVDESTERSVILTEKSLLYWGVLHGSS